MIRIVIYLLLGLHVIIWSGALAQERNDGRKGLWLALAVLSLYALIGLGHL